MFTEARREQVRTQLLGAEDTWSNIDLFFGAAEGYDVAETLEEWSASVYRELGALHHFNLQSGAASYRAFLLSELLEIRLAWHHVLHARFSIERSAPLQAEYWITAVRDETPAVACLRRGSPAAYAMGSDRLPAEVTGPVRDPLVRSLDTDELSRALRAATRALIGELRETDTEVANRLSQPLLAMTARQGGRF